MSNREITKEKPAAQPVLRGSDVRTALEARSFAKLVTPKVLLQGKLSEPIFGKTLCITFVLVIQAIVGLVVITGPRGIAHRATRAVRRRSASRRSGSSTARACTP